MLSPPTKPVFLVGFMGTGKSTVATLLAARWSWPCVDLDERIEERAGATVRELFANEGEARFRELETDALKSITGLQVVAVGGGAVTRSENLKFMQSHGVMVCLRARPETILERIGDAASRPLLAKAKDKHAEVERLLKERAPFYQQARVFVDTDGLSPSHVASRIEAELCKG
jgi:shikimate kinase